MPSGTIARALLAAAEVPIAAPSANTFSRPSATTAQHVLQDLDGRIDLILDSGATAIGVESTVLDITGDTPTVLRPGGVPLEALRALLPNLRVREKYTAMDSNTADASPGMLIKHYAPRAAVHLFAGDDAAAVAAMRERAASLLTEGKRVGVLLFDEEHLPFASLRVDIESLGSIDMLETAAARLFAALRDLDARGVDAIVVRAPKRRGLGAAIYDRLRRAAQGVITTI
jgi:L-threonylcarbamoyladenylate synthase